MSPVTERFGTEEPVVGGRLGAGRLSATLQDGSPRHVRSSGAEIVRAGSCVVRDHAWGIAAAVIEDRRIDEAPTPSRQAGRARAGRRRPAVDLARRIRDRRR